MSGSTGAGGGGRQPIAASFGAAAGAAQRSAGSTPDSPSFVWTPRAALATLPGVDDVSYMGYDLQTKVNAIVLNTTYAIGTVTVPAQQVLDLSEVSFVVCRSLPGGGYAPLGDWMFLDYARFSFIVNGVNPWDQFSIRDVGGTVTRRVGWYVLNQNELASWSDTPVHLVIAPTRVVQFQFTVDALGVLTVSDAVFARVRGRWLPGRLWNELSGWSR